ncbi:hypothetical protein ACJROX_10245 [Pseudalkalibacillus sp. A8]|uniref:hypothetical protein n=1 Tax=Pseudalkalibacillus sp. A8 TaxID=3382641 RepID=UPI0038B5E748
MKYILILTEVQFKKDAELKEKDLQRENITVEIKLLDPPVDRMEIDRMLEAMPLGAMVIIFTAGETRQLIRQAANTAGFSDEDIRIERMDTGNYRIFCSKCHLINDTASLEKSLICKKCGQHLEPSDHYSRYHDSYLGYSIL